MIYRDGTEFKLMPLIAKWTEQGKTYEKHVTDELEMRGFEAMGYIADLKFEQAEYDPAMLARLDEVSHEANHELVETYVLTGEMIEIEPIVVPDPPEPTPTLDDRVTAVEDKTATLAEIVEVIYG